MGEVYTRFQTKTAQKRYPMGQRIAYIREYPTLLRDVYIGLRLLGGSLRYIVFQGRYELSFKIMMPPVT